MVVDGGPRSGPFNEGNVPGLYSAAVRRFYWRPPARIMPRQHRDSSHDEQAGLMEHCRNCNEPLSGEYCYRCGQREHGDDIRLRDLAGEALEELGQLDGRIWRTLIGLVIHPGRVTVDYLAGHRARYIPPLRLYLVVSFLVFLIMSLAPVNAVISIDTGLDPEFAEEHGHGPYVPVEREDGSRDTLTLKEYLEEQELDMADQLSALFGGDSEAPDWLQKGFRQLVDNAGKLEEEPGMFLELLLQRLPQMMFLLLPLFALLLRLSYLFSPFHYLQHFIFSLHYHTAAFLLLILLWPVRFLLPGDFGGLVMMFMLIYLPIALARVYGSGKVAATARGLIVGISYYLLLLAAGTIYLLVTLALM